MVLSVVVAITHLLQFVQHFSKPHNPNAKDSGPIVWFNKKFDNLTVENIK